MIDWPTDEGPVDTVLPEYRSEVPSPGVRLEAIAETPIGQTELFDGMDAERSATSALLTDRFVVPPFSVLDSRAGYWQSRKAQWLALGIQSELGRGERPGALPLTGSAGSANVAAYEKRALRREADTRSNLNGAQTLPDYAKEGTGNANMAPGTSIFDPVLCELAYRWFCPPSGSVFDPFAGGSVRGIVAAMLGHRYTGIDLSLQQVEANRAQAASILAGGDYLPPVWMQGDSANLNRLLVSEGHYDLLFSCPPYYDLEVYSESPGELSTMPSYDEFLRAYRLIIALASERLRPDRFAVWVVGEIRDKAGMQRGFVTDTIIAFREAGLELYNEAVLVNSVGTLALRAPRQFVAGRKLGRSHQAVLVFAKGKGAGKW